MKEWKIVKLGSVIKQVKDTVQISPTELYKQITVKLYHKGVIQRKIIKGSEIISKQYLAKRGYFIISKIDARNGAFGIVPAELDNSIVSGDFILFEPNSELLLDYLHLITQTSAFNLHCKNASEGSTNRVRLKMDRFLNYSISLPTIQKQTELVNKIKSIQETIDQIQILKYEQEKEIRSLSTKLYDKIISNVPFLTMNEVCPVIRREVQIKEIELYPELGLRSFGKGSFHKPAISGIEVGTKKLFKIERGDLIFSNVFAWEGAIAVAKEIDAGRFGSHRFISCIANRDMILPEFLCFHFLTMKGLEDINSASPGGAGRNKTLGLQKLMNIKVPIPKLKIQQLFIEEINKFQVITTYHQKTLEELKAMMPSLLEKAFEREFTDTSINSLTNSISSASLERLFLNDSALVDKQSIIYTRVAIDTYILNFLKNDPNLHRTKMEKVNHLIEYHCEVDLQRHPVRDTAGPNDYSSRLKVEVLASQLGFYATKTTVLKNGFKEISYILPDLDLAKVKIAEDYFAERIDKVNILLNLIRPLNTRQSEIIATLYGSWNDFLINGKHPTDNEIIQDVRNNWDIKKKKIPQPLWDWGLNWMRVNNIIPKGRGKVVLQKLKQP